jgi:hypothetical protein
VARNRSRGYDDGPRHEINIHNSTAKKGPWLLVILLAAALVFVGLPGKKAEPTAQAKAPTSTCSITDPQSLLSKLLGNAQQCIDELKGGAPATGDGHTAYIKFDGTSWSQTGQAVQDPKAKANQVQIISSGTTPVSVTVHDGNGKALFTSEGTRGQAALMAVSYVGLATPPIVRIEDTERGTFEVALT